MEFCRHAIKFAEGRKKQGSTWWWNEQVKDMITRIAAN